MMETFYHEGLPNTKQQYFVAENLLYWLEYDGTFCDCLSFPGNKWNRMYLLSQSPT